MKVQLKDIAHGRCGDKSDTSNICIYARKPEYYSVMENILHQIVYAVTLKVSFW